MFRCAALVVLSLTVFSVSAYAGDETLSSATDPTPSREQVTLSAGNVEWSQPRVGIDARRPRVLPFLYVSFAALQGFDAYSTTTALNRGGREANPIMTGVAGNPAAFWAVKAATTAGSIWVAERLWKKNRVGAIVTMVTVNGVMASVAARNASVLKALR